MANKPLYYIIIEYNIIVLYCIVLVGWKPRLLGWLAGWLLGWLVSWLVGSLVRERAPHSTGVVPRAQAQALRVTTYTYMLLSTVEFLLSVQITIEEQIESSAVQLPSCMRQLCWHLLLKFIWCETAFESVTLDDLKNSMDSALENLQGFSVLP